MAGRCRCSRYRFFAVFYFRQRQTALTTENMAASSDRNPPPFPATEESGAERTDMADGDSDEGEDIFVNNVCLQFFSVIFERSVIIYPLRLNEPVTAALSDQTGCQERSENIFFKQQKWLFNLSQMCFLRKILNLDCMYSQALFAVFIPNGRCLSTHQWP